MTVYLGFDLLDQTEHSRNEPRTARFLRTFDLLDYLTGARMTVDHGGSPIGERPMRWMCSSRAEITTFRNFLLARRGRAVPFWIPTFQRDFTLTEVIQDTGSGLTFQRFGYAKHVFPTGGARRHIRVQAPGLPTVFRRVVAAADPGNGITESLTVDTAFDDEYPVSSLISCLLFCRLAEDQVELEWPNNSVVVADFDVRELPREAPT